jgi:hypothetical protein
MRFMLVGYGSGSRDVIGKSKQYKTLRGEIGSKDQSIKFQERGVLFDGKTIPCVSFEGKTNKRGKGSMDNPVSLLLYGLSEDQALELSARLSEYAIFLRDNNGEKNASVSFTESANYFAQNAIKILKSGPRHAMILFLDELEKYWENEVNEIENKIQTLKRISQIKKSIKAQKDKENNCNIATEDDFIQNIANQIDAYSRKKSWRATCADSLRNLIRYYKAGEEPINSKPQALKLIISNTNE